MVIDLKDDGAVLVASGMRGPSIRNRIAESCIASDIAEGRRIAPGAVRWVVVHRTSLSRRGPDNPNPIADQDLDGPGLTNRFRLSPAAPPNGLGTGGRPPYHLLVRTDAVVEQVLPLEVRGAHAVGINAESWAVAIAGDGRPCSAEQLRTAAALCALLVPVSGAELVGHTDLAGASRDSSKRCPWPVVDVTQLRAMVRDWLPTGWQTWRREFALERAIDAGLVLSA
jgi:hypothetical protein